MASTAVAQRAVLATLPVVPRAAVERFARRYVAGATLDHAVAVTRRLASDGRHVTYDILAEEQNTVAASRALAEEYEGILRRIARDRLSATLSLRMTALGLNLDRALCRELLGRVVGRAGQLDVQVTIDMEDSSTTTDTLESYRRLRAEGRENVGIVLQACLRRTREDVRALAGLAPRVRVVKGVWPEPYSAAFHDPDIIRGSYLRTVERLLDAGSYVELATHDEWLLEEALERVRRAGYDGSSYECQMLLGVRPELGDAVLSDGHRLRIYVPYGEQWYPYCLRRLRESPDVARHVVADTTRRLRKRLMGR